MPAAVGKPKPAPRSTEEWRDEVERLEGEFKASLDRVSTVVQNATDWRRVVREHPVECALAAAAAGFLLASRPSLLTRPAGRGSQSLLETGSSEILRAVIARLL